MGRVYRQTDRIVIFFPDSFEGEADLLVDEVVAVAFAVSRVQHVVIFAPFFTGIRVFQRFLFVLPDAVGCLNEVVVCFLVVVLPAEEPETEENFGLA